MRGAPEMVDCPIDVEGHSMTEPTFDDRGLINPAPLDEDGAEELVEPAEVIQEPPPVLVFDDDDLVYDPS